MSITSKIATRSTPRRLTILAALSLGGLGVSVYLTQHYYEVRGGAAGFKSICNISQAMNCDAVAASTYADFAAGMPLSSFAAGWFLALFVIALIARNPFWRREAMRVALVITGLSVAFSLYYLWVMMGVLHTLCLFCLVTDAINLAALGIVLSLKPEGFAAHPLDRAKWKPMLGLTAVSLLVAVLGLRALDSSASMPAATVQEMAASTLSSPVLPINAGANFPSIGAANAPVTIVEFSDFQCPFCRIGAFVMNSVVAQHPGQVRVVFRNFPLDNTCNRIMERPLHLYSCDAAKHVICANQQGKFEAVYENLFENQASFGPGRIDALTQETGADMQKMAACLSTPETASAVSRDIEEGITLGINGTPTFFINGHKVEGYVPPPKVWNRMIDELLKQQKQPAAAASK
jgi:protein-disulfide isomerase